MAPDPKADDITSAASANAASTTKKNSKKKNKKDTIDDGSPAAAQEVNGNLHAPPPSTPAQSQREELLAERAENKAAVAAVALLADKPQDQHTPLTAAERILAKRSKALGKKLQRITQYEAQDTKTLNEDQKVVIATKDSVMAAMKELNEVGKAWRQAEKDVVAEQQAETQKALDHQKKSGQADGDATLTLLQHFLRLFTLLHLPQIEASSFASTLPSGFTDSISSQEAAAIGKLYQDIVSLPLYSGAETGQSNQGSVMELLSAIENGQEGKEVLQGVSYARIRTLISQLIAPPPSSVAAEKIPEAAKSGAHTGLEPPIEEKANVQETIDIAPELIEPAAKTDSEVTKAPHTNGSAHQPAAAIGGISFLQSSEVSRTASSATSLAGDADGLAAHQAAVSGFEAEGGRADTAPPNVPGEAILRTTDGGKGRVSGEENDKQATSVPTSASKFDWSADVEGGDNDLGDPLKAFTDQQGKLVNGTNGGALLGQKTTHDGDEDKEVTTASQTAEQSANPGDGAVPVSNAKATTGDQGAGGAKSQAPLRLSQHQHRKGSKANANGSTPETPHEKQQSALPTSSISKKTPVVDEDGFVLQTSKKSLHQQQQQAQAQAQAQQSGFRGAGRGRGRGSSRGRGARGEFRGAAKAGRGAAAGGAAPPSV